MPACTNWVKEAKQTLNIFHYCSHKKFRDKSYLFSSWLIKFICIENFSVKAVHSDLYHKNTRIHKIIIQSTIGKPVANITFCWVPQSIYIRYVGQCSSDYRSKAALDRWIFKLDLKEFSVSDALQFSRSLFWICGVQKLNAALVLVLGRQSR